MKICLLRIHKTLTKRDINAAPNNLQYLPTHLLVEPLHTLIGGTSPHTYWWNLPTHLLMIPTYTFLAVPTHAFIGDTYVNPHTYWWNLFTHLSVEPTHTLLFVALYVSGDTLVTLVGYTCVIMFLRTVIWANRGGHTGVVMATIYVHWTTFTLNKKPQYIWLQISLCWVIIYDIGK